MQGLVGAYRMCMARAPYTTQAVSSGVLWGMGDSVAQQWSAEERFNARRMLTTAAYGAALIGPAGHWWYQALDKIALRFARRGSLAFVAGKVATDTAVFGPLHVGGYFGVMAVAERCSWEDFAQKMRRDFVPTLMADSAVWPLIQALNFRFVPVSSQLLFVNSFVVVDSAFMSWARATDDWAGKVLAMIKGGGADEEAGERSRSGDAKGAECSEMASMPEAL